MSIGRFIVSLDCEGKWGMADRSDIPWVRDLTNERLAEAYSALVTLLARHGIDATFAFVGALTLSAEEARENPGWFEPCPIDGKDWLRHWRLHFERGDHDGWFVPELLDIVRSRGDHEIGTHGFLHIPLDEGSVSAAVFSEDLRRSRTVAAWRGYEPRTLIYPRNRIGHVSRLSELGIVGYREALYAGDRRPSRLLRSLAAEINVLDSPQRDAPSRNGLVPVPPGHILNWRYGARARIPASVTVRRWRHMLEQAAGRGGVVHLWSHPHNFISGDGMLELLDAILEAAAEHVREGSLETMTQYGYSMRALQAPSSGSQGTTTSHSGRYP